MTAVYSVCLTLLLAVLTALGERRKADRAVFRRLNRDLGFVGAAGLLVTLAYGLAVLLPLDGTNPARVTAGGYALAAGGVFLAVLLLLSVSLLLRRRGAKDSRFSRTVRVLLSLAGSAACLLLSSLWILIASGGKPDLTALYYFCGVCFALILRLPLSAEYLQ